LISCVFRTLRKISRANDITNVVDDLHFTSYRTLNLLIHASKLQTISFALNISRYEYDVSLMLISLNEAWDKTFTVESSKLNDDEYTAPRRLLFKLLGGILRESLSRYNCVLDAANDRNNFSYFYGYTIH